MHYIVSLSGGVASAVAAMRAERQRLAAQANLYITGFLAAKVPMRRRG